MQIQRTEYNLRDPEVTILDGVAAQKALVRLARFHGVEVPAVRDELAKGFKMRTLGVTYQMTVAPGGCNGEER